MNTVVMIAGGFHPLGAMDRANYELAWHLADRVRAKVCLVSHAVQARLASHPNVTWHYVPRPLKSYALGEILLRWRGRWIANHLKGRNPRVVVNGGNCPWPDINWVHAFHAAWDRRDYTAPLFFRLRSRWFKSIVRRSESNALAVARLIVTNSSRTRQHILDHYRRPPKTVHTVYLGIDPAVYAPSSDAIRTEARRYFGLPDKKPLVGFIGALGYDRNKGFDVAFAAWHVLCQQSSWDADLVVAGGGQEVGFWRHEASKADLAERIHFLGFTAQIPKLLASIDTLVSPTNYESYGMNVHEALCFGLPAFVTRTAGIAERYPNDLADLLICEPPGPRQLVDALWKWRKDIRGYKDRVLPFCTQLRQRTWEHMAQDIVALMNETSL
jgi:glycosyltransferase involved in cell wall biosynthesis